MGWGLSDLVVDNVNETERKISCYDSSDIPITNAVAASYAGATGLDAVPSLSPRRAIIGKPCGSGNSSIANGAVDSYAGTLTADKVGTVKYDIEVYGAGSLNNLSVLIYWVMIVVISLGMIGGGGVAVARGISRQIAAI